MTKGKPWSVEEEKQLREMVQEHKRLNEIARFFGKSPASIKMNHLFMLISLQEVGEPMLLKSFFLPLPRLKIHPALLFNQSLQKSLIAG